MVLTSAGPWRSFHDCADSVHLTFVEGILLPDTVALGRTVLFHMPFNIASL
jgi:hypothetical protein